MKTYSAFWLFTIGVLVALLIPTLVQDGMYLDGVTYSSISRNLANGIGTLFQPHYTKTVYPIFYEHPPLIFGIQSIFFRILGGGIYTERIYTLSTAVLTAYGLILCWRLYNKESDYKKYSWLPVLLWISIPVVFWSYKNNMLENTMGVFTLFSIYFLSQALIQERKVWLILSSLFIVFAFLSKGFTGLFPLIFILLYWIVLKSKKNSVFLIYGLISIVLPIIVFYFLLFLFPDLKVNISSYFKQQVIPALNNKRENTTSNHFSILFNLLIELALPLLLLISVLIIQKLKNGTSKFYNLNTGVLFLLTGISGSLPLIITLKQSTHYLIPSIPFYILGISFIVVPFIKINLETFSESILIWLKRVSIALLVLVLIISIFKIRNYSRDEEELKDIYLISQSIPKGTIISTSKKHCQDWLLIAYLSRIGYLSLDCVNQNEFYLLNKDDKLESEFNEIFYKLDLNLKQYAIYKKNIF